MTRDLRPGDRVTATGTVTITDIYATLEPGVKIVAVKWDRNAYDAGRGSAIDTDALTLIEPAEPPVGSVVVKDGIAWTREDPAYTGQRLCWRGNSGLIGVWSDLSDGDVIFTGGDS